MDALVEQLMESPRLPEIVDDLRARLAAERGARKRFYEEIGDGEKWEFINGEKWEFINGEAIMHSPDRVEHMEVRSLLENLLGNHVRRHRLGSVLSEKGLCVFPRNDFMPDVLFFGPEKAAHLKPKQLKLPPPDFIAEILSDSTAARDRGVKFRDYEAHGVREYWLVDADGETLEQYVVKKGVFTLALKSGSGEVQSAVVPGFTIPIRALFDPVINLEALQALLSRAAPKS